MMTEIVSLKEIDKAVKILRKGGIIIYPTETSYGLGCDATNKKSVKRLYKIKKRVSKPLISLVLDKKMAEKYFEVNKTAKILIDKFSPGPLTYVCNRKKLSKEIGNNGHSFRISSNRFVQKLLKKYKKPIISTSANISGKPALYNFYDVKKIFYNKVDLIVNSGNLRKRKLSTVFDTRTLEVLRKGAISKKDIQKYVTKNGKK